LISFQLIWKFLKSTEDENFKMSNRILIKSPGENPIKIKISGLKEFWTIVDSKQLYSLSIKIL